jgi:predicted signal transduction protein with EAL and GGDEF domain
VRQSDTVARLGGDEFTVVLGAVREIGDVAQVGGKLIEALQQGFHIDGTEVFIGASIGISIYPEDGEDFVTLTKNADTAMYLAKQSGRGAYRFFTADMNAANARRLALEASLRGALERGELELHYQPQVDADRRMIGVEALLRWQHPELGMVPPSEFIPLAEETGLIVPIGDWVLRTACAQLEAWHRAGYADLHVAVNLSARQFEKEGLVDDVREVLTSLDLPPSALELELTESMLMRDAAQALEVMHGLRELGVGLSVDDFGTGHSSLSYLKRLPIQSLKIDRSFVRDIVADPDDVAIIRAILSMAERLRLKVVAEGVETAAQHAFLRAEGCDQAQGFHYAQPLDGRAALDYLAVGFDRAQARRRPQMVRDEAELGVEEQTGS